MAKSALLLLGLLLLAPTAAFSAQGKSVLQRKKTGALNTNGKKALIAARDRAAAHNRPARKLPAMRGVVVANYEQQQPTGLLWKGEADGVTVTKGGIGFAGTVVFDHGKITSSTESFEVDGNGVAAHSLTRARGKISQTRRTLWVRNAVMGSEVTLLTRDGYRNEQFDAKGVLRSRTQRRFDGLQVHETFDESGALTKRVAQDRPGAAPGTLSHFVGKRSTTQIVDGAHLPAFITPYFDSLPQLQRVH